MRKGGTAKSALVWLKIQMNVLNVKGKIFLRAIDLFASINFTFEIFCLYMPAAVVFQVHLILQDSSTVIEDTSIRGIRIFSGVEEG